VTGDLPGGDDATAAEFMAAAIPSEFVLPG
jgi:hypothetical protein